MPNGWRGATVISTATVRSPSFADSGAVKAPGSGSVLAATLTPST
jgi:hypothetical protein